MPNLGKILKDEIVRLSKKNALAMAKPLNNQIRSLKKQLRDAQVSLKALEAAVRKSAAARGEPVQDEAEPKAGRAFTGKGIKSLRRKLKITQAELARLAKVSSQAVVMWERKSGKIRLRHATYETLSAVRAMRKADVKAALAPAAEAKSEAKKK